MQELTKEKPEYRKTLFFKNPGHSKGQIDALHNWPRSVIREGNLHENCQTLDEIEKTLTEKENGLRRERKIPFKREILHLPKEAAPPLSQPPTSWKIPVKEVRQATFQNGSLLVRDNLCLCSACLGIV